MADRFDDATQVRVYLVLVVSNPNRSPPMLQKELQSFLEREQAQARLQQSIHTFTSMCWDKCVLSQIILPTPLLLTHPFADITLALCATDASPARPRHGSLGVKRVA